MPVSFQRLQRLDNAINAMVTKHHRQQHTQSLEALSWAQALCDVQRENDGSREIHLVEDATKLTSCLCNIVVGIVCVCAKKKASLAGPAVKRMLYLKNQLFAS